MARIICKPKCVNRCKYSYMLLQERFNNSTFQKRMKLYIDIYGCAHRYQILFASLDKVCIKSCENFDNEENVRFI